MLKKMLFCWSEYSYDNMEMGLYFSIQLTLNLLSYILFVVVLS